MGAYFLLYGLAFVAIKTAQTVFNLDENSKTSTFSQARHTYYVIPGKVAIQKKQFLHFCERE